MSFQMPQLKSSSPDRCWPRGRRRPTRAWRRRPRPRGRSWRRTTARTPRRCAYRQGGPVKGRARNTRYGAFLSKKWSSLFFYFNHRWNAWQAEVEEWAGKDGKGGPPVHLGAALKKCKVHFHNYIICLQKKYSAFFNKLLPPFPPGWSTDREARGSQDLRTVFAEILGPLPTKKLGQIPVFTIWKLLWQRTKIKSFGQKIFF